MKHSFIMPLIWFVVWEIVLAKPQLFFFAFVATVLWAVWAIWRASGGFKQKFAQSVGFDSWGFVVYGTGISLSALLFLLFLERGFGKHALLIVLFGLLSLFLTFISESRAGNESSYWSLAWLTQGMVAAALFFFHVALYGLLVFLQVSVPILLAVQAGAVAAFVLAFFHPGRAISSYLKQAFFLTFVLSEVFWALSLLPIAPMVASAVFGVVAVWFLELIKAQMEFRLSLSLVRRSALFSSALLLLILSTARWS